MISNSPHEQERLRELEALIELGETSTKAVDSLTEQIAKVRFGILSQVLFVYFGVFTLVIALLYSSNTTYISAGINALAVQGSILIALFFLLVFFIRQFLNVRRLMGKLRSDLEIELHVQHKLISMIDQQFRRTASEVRLSPVTAAVFDIRVRRLERQYAIQSKKKVDRESK